jgi:hypothetical protein
MQPQLVGFSIKEESPDFSDDDEDNDNEGWQ